MTTVRQIANALALTKRETLGFVDMIAAVASRRVLPPRTNWAHNFSNAPDPGWFWVRPHLPAGHVGEVVVQGSVWWGEALQGPFRMRCDLNGILVRLVTTAPNPPLEVTLDQAGWVDFGRGDVRADVLEECRITGIDGRALLRLAAPLDPGLEDSYVRRGGRTFDIARDAARHLGLRWQIFSPHLGMLRPRPMPHALDGTSLATVSSAPGGNGDGIDEASTRQAWFDGPGLKAIREARGLTRGQVVAGATRFLGRPVTVKNLEYVERSGRIPGPDGFLAFLDGIYRVDGRLGVETTYASRTTYGSRAEHVVVFPHFYVGPIWVQTSAPGDPSAAGLLELVWAPWRRRQYVMSGVLLTSRKAHRGTQPLIVRAPEGWSVKCGTGAAPTATDINHGWYPVSFMAVLSLLRQSAETVLVARRGQAAPRSEQDEDDWDVVVDAPDASDEPRGLIT